MELGKYTVLTSINTTGCFPDPADSLCFREYIVQDLSLDSPRCMFARLYDPGSRRWAAEEENLKLLDAAGLTRGPLPHVVVPFDRFTCAENGKNFQCLVYDELLGPNMVYMIEMNGPEDELWPKDMALKMASEILKGLAYIHAHGTTAGKETRVPA
jgi:hypothetical protein